MVSANHWGSRVGAHLSPYAPATSAPPGSCPVHVSGQPGSNIKGGHHLTLYIVDYDAADCSLQQARQAPTCSYWTVTPIAPFGDAVDVVALGAGLADLTAAREVLRKGYSCVVLEARDRVGLQDDNNQCHVYALAKEFGAGFIEQNTTGNCAMQAFDGGPHMALGPVIEPLLTRYGIISSTQLSPSNPRTTRALDAVVFEACTCAHATRARRSLATGHHVDARDAGPGQDGDPADVSVLFFLHYLLAYCASGGGAAADAVPTAGGGGQHLRVRQGMAASH
ncbi:hypothetical protein GGR56DRAFT_673496 [Xylariaceae sp. FL0804]|nr:hypothetical protein GGR56DRAFT_673496 [Xylariaceae sp. FL0804]